MTIASGKPPPPDFRPLGCRECVDGAGLAFEFSMALQPILDLDARRVFAHEALVRGMLQVCRELGIRVVAEGIETEAELRALRGMGVALVQGYLFARPAFEAVAALPDGVWDLGA